MDEGFAPFSFYFARFVQVGHVRRNRRPQFVDSSSR